jgi:hypothetical protein
MTHVILLVVASSTKKSSSPKTIVSLELRVPFQICLVPPTLTKLTVITTFAVSLFCMLRLFTIRLALPEGEATMVTGVEPFNVPSLLPSMNAMLYLCKPIEIMSMPHPMQAHQGINVRAIHRPEKR